MKVYLLAACFSLRPPAHLLNLRPDFSFMSFSFDARDAGAEAAIAAANQAIEQCTQIMRGRSVDTVCTFGRPSRQRTKTADMGAEASICRVAAPGS